MGTERVSVERFCEYGLRYKEYDQVRDVYQERTGASVGEGVWQMGEV